MIEVEAHSNKFDKFWSWTRENPNFKKEWRNIWNRIEFESIY